MFNTRDGFQDLPVTVRCRNCIGCRLDRAREWAIRIQNEAQCHELNIFVTLTYNDENLPLSLDKKHFIDFIKRLRKHAEMRIRYFHCGEYGELTQRPHYHAILFGIDFPDKKWHSDNKQGDKLYTSKTLTEIWGKGHVWIGAVTAQSAQYVARYIMKKVTGDNAEGHYQGRQPEYITMSLKPGIGSDWYQKYKKDVYPSDTCIVEGKEQKPPKYYDNIHEKEAPKAHEAIVNARKRFANKKQQKENSTPERLRVREICRKSKTSLMKRDAE